MMERYWVSLSTCYDFMMEDYAEAFYASRSRDSGRIRDTLALYNGVRVIVGRWRAHLWTICYRRSRLNKTSFTVSITGTYGAEQTSRDRASALKIKGTGLVARNASEIYHEHLDMSIYHYANCLLGRNNLGVKYT